MSGSLTLVCGCSSTSTSCIAHPLMDERDVAKTNRATAENVKHLDELMMRAAIAVHT